MRISRSGKNAAVESTGCCDARHFIGPGVGTSKPLGRFSIRAPLHAEGSQSALHLSCPECLTASTRGGLVSLTPLRRRGYMALEAHFWAHRNPPNSAMSSVVASVSVRKVDASKCPFSSGISFVLRKGEVVWMTGPSGEFEECCVSL